MKWLLPIAISVLILNVLVMFVLFIVAIWTGENRFGETGLIALFGLLFTGPGVYVAWEIQND